MARTRSRQRELGSPATLHRKHGPVPFIQPCRPPAPAQREKRLGYWRLLCICQAHAEVRPPRLHLCLCLHAYWVRQNRPGPLHPAVPATCSRTAGEAATGPCRTLVRLTGSSQSCRIPRNSSYGLGSHLGLRIAHGHQAVRARRQNGQGHRTRHGLGGGRKLASHHSTTRSVIRQVDHLKC